MYRFLNRRVWRPESSQLTLSKKFCSLGAYCMDSLSLQGMTDTSRTSGRQHGVHVIPMWCNVYLYFMLFFFAKSKFIASKKQGGCFRKNSLHFWSLVLTIFTPFVCFHAGGGFNFILWDKTFRLCSFALLVLPSLCRVTKKIDWWNKIEWCPISVSPLPRLLRWAPLHLCSSKLF